MTVGNDDQDAIDKGVERMFDVPLELRRLKHLSLPPQSAAKGSSAGSRAACMARSSTTWKTTCSFTILQLFDFASLGDKHNDLLEVEMSWILLLCQNVIRDQKNLGMPKHIVIDELWKRMGVLPVLAFVLETIKADRKNLAWATLVTQSLEDLGQLCGADQECLPEHDLSGRCV